MLACSTVPMMNADPQNCSPTAFNNCNFGTPSMMTTSKLLSLLQLMKEQQTTHAQGHVQGHVKVSSLSMSTPSFPAHVSGNDASRHSSTNFAPTNTTLVISQLLQQKPPPLTVQPTFSNLGLASTLEFAKSVLSGNGGSPAVGPSTPRMSCSPLLAQSTTSTKIHENDSDSSAFPPSSPSNSDDNKKSRYWTDEEHERFLQAIRIFGAYDHKAIAKFVETRSPGQVRSHSQKFFKKLESFDGQGLPSMDRKTYKKRDKKNSSVSDDASNRSSPSQ